MLPAAGFSREDVNPVTMQHMTQGCLLSFPPMSIPLLANFFKLYEVRDNVSYQKSLLKKTELGINAVTSEVYRKIHT